MGAIRLPQLPRRRLPLTKHYAKPASDVEAWDCGRHCVGAHGGAARDVHLVCIGLGGAALVSPPRVAGIRCITAPITPGSHTQLVTCGGHPLRKLPPSHGDVAICYHHQIFMLGTVDICIVGV